MSRQWSAARWKKYREGMPKRVPSPSEHDHDLALREAREAEEAVREANRAVAAIKAARSKGSP